MTVQTAARLGKIGAWIVKAIVCTLRFRIEDRAGVLGTREPRLIWLFWHNRLFVIPHLLKRYLPERPGSALTSPSKDGQIIASLLEEYSVRPVRGSSSRRGVAAMIELARLIRDGYDVAITPDGPRGPCYTLNPGAITLAQRTGAKVMPIRVHYSRCWQVKSWDRFMIPQPFARVTITLLPLEVVAATASEASFEAERARIEGILRAEQP